MTADPKFLFFLSHSKHPVLPGSPIWQEALPLKPGPDRASSRSGKDAPFCYGDYFDAAGNFLKKDDYVVLKRAIHLQSKAEADSKKLKEIHIYLEKHGEFYHPSRVAVTVDGQEYSFVLNVAVSETGKAHIQNEYQCLKRLTREFSYGYLPEVYGEGQAFSPGNRRIGLFLGQWFKGFNEFHLSTDEETHKKTIIVWKDRDQYRFLSDKETHALYAQASKILTLYYNAVTFERISAWHHGAGDFVIRAENGQPEVKLISVRSYKALFRPEKEKMTSRPSAQSIMYGLLIFFLSLMIHMRLDRKGGVGEILWSDDVAVYGSLSGVLSGLSEKPEPPGLPDSISACFKSLLFSCTTADLMDLSRLVAEKTLSKTPELHVADRHLKQHAHALHEAIRQNL